jgi:hypothetical protein
MLTSMKMKIIAARTLLYETTKYVDLRSGYTHLVDNPHGEVDEETRRKQKMYSKIAAVLTPMSKALSTEVANQVAYDGIQIHGGTGYMKDFNAERYYRDARITNIYEGTTQLQVVAAIGGVVQRVLDPLMDKLAAIPLEGHLLRLRNQVNEMRKRQEKAVAFVQEKRDSSYHDLTARHLVSMETMLYVSYLLLRDAQRSPAREPFAERYILDAIPEFEKSYMIVTSGDFTVIDKHRDIIEY